MNDVKDLLQEGIDRFNQFGTLEFAEQFVYTCLHRTGFPWDMIQSPRPEDFRIEKMVPKVRPSISIAVSNWNHADQSKKFFAALNNQLKYYPVDKFEILYVDHHSDDEHTFDHVEKALEKYPALYSTIQCFETNENFTQGLSYAINVAARRASGDLLMILPSDTLLLNADYLLNTALIHEYFEKYWSKLQNGVIVTPLCHDTKKEYRKAPIWLNYSRDMGSSLPTELFQDIHGFDEEIRGWGGAEVDLFNRLKKVDVPICCAPSLRYIKLSLNPTWHKYCGGINKVTLKGDVCANDDNWGNRDMIEEINF